MHTQVAAEAAAALVRMVLSSLALLPRQSRAVEAEQGGRGRAGRSRQSRAVEAGQGGRGRAGFRGRARRAGQGGRERRAIRADTRFCLSSCLLEQLL